MFSPVRSCFLQNNQVRLCVQNHLSSMHFSMMFSLSKGAAFYEPLNILLSLTYICHISVNRLPAGRLWNTTLKTPFHTRSKICNFSICWCHHTDHPQGPTVILPHALTNVKSTHEVRPPRIAHALSGCFIDRWKGYRLHCSLVGHFSLVGHSMIASRREVCPHCL